MEVERLRLAAVKRKRMGRVGMVLTVEQVLDLIARGDAQQMQWMLRVEELENQIGAMKARAYLAEPEPAEIDDGWLPIDEACEATGLSRHYIERLARAKLIQWRKLPVWRGGQFRRMRCVELDGVGYYAEMELPELKRELKVAQKVAVS